MLALFTFLPLILPAGAAAQSNTAPVSAAPTRESPQDLIARLNPQQKQQFDEAGKLFGGKQYTDALAIYKRLLADLPGDAVLSKFASEAALNSGDTAFALSTLKPIAQADPEDWQAAALLTRASAESGDTAARDAGIAHMIELRTKGVTPPGMQQYTLEQVTVGETTLVVRMSLVPWGYYKIYALGQVFNPQGKIFLRATLESNDADQALFAKEHPDEAAKGLRGFSLDGYLDTGTNGQRTQTHYTYKFFVGQPSYDVVRAEFIKIAGGKATPLSSRENLVVP
jgi:tetratricopeptide (TPR) repeat protein